MKHAEIIKQMTLDEKISMITGYGSWHTFPVERLGVKSIMMTDGPVGLRKVDEGKTAAYTSVCFPSGCLTACSFDRDLLYRMGDAIGKECQAYDVGMILGPAINIKRSPLCGRNFEYFSEDPYLAGEMAAAYINGVQKNNVMTSLKHFAANNQEYRRMSYNAVISERALREIYLKGFEIAVKKSQPGTLMCSYNKVNGEHVSESRKILNDILRDEWGFEGAVISDWGAVYEKHMSVKNGLDLEMPGNNNANAGFIKTALSDGTLTMPELDIAVDRIISLTEKYIHEDRKFDFEEDHLLSREIAEQSIVLLKNNDILPLKKNENYCVIGGFAKTPRYQGGGSAHIESYRIDSPLEIMKEYCKPDYSEGFSAFDDTENITLMEEAVKHAKSYGMAVVFAGLPDNYESEGYDRKHMRLPECQNKLIEMLCNEGIRTIVVLQNGAAVELPWADKVDGILEAYLCGEAAGVAITRVLFGDVNPSGKLAETFPVKLSDNPSFFNFPGDGKNVYYAEDVYVGYRYYDKKEMKVTFPFGHGLSYTSFDYSDLTISSDKVTDSENITISFKIKNTGKYSGAEVVQLYIGSGYPAIGAHTERPVKELKNFEKIFLNPGEEKDVEFSLSINDFAYYEERINDWYSPSAEYSLLIGSSSRDIRLSSNIRVITSKRLPLHITGDTTFGELLADERTQKYTMDNLIRQEASGIQSFGPEAIRAMQDHNPLRGLRNFSNKTADEVNRIITEIKDLTEWE